MYAADGGRVEVVRLLGQKLGANIHQTKKDGWTALMTAAEKGHVEVVRLLGQKLGEDVNHANKHKIATRR
jgi:ankyrin repeat protein